MVRYKFPKAIDWNTRLTHSSVYAVQSEYDKDLIYLFEDGEAAMVRHRDGMRWKISETSRIAETIVNEEIKKEIIEIYKEVRGMENRICEYCGKEYTPVTGIQRFCGSKCSNKFYTKERAERRAKKKTKKTSNIDIINREAISNGISYGKYQAMKYLDTVESIK